MIGLAKQETAMGTDQSGIYLLENFNKNLQKYWIVIYDVMELSSKKRPMYELLT